MGKALASLIIVSLASQHEGLGKVRRCSSTAKSFVCFFLPRSLALSLSLSLSFAVPPSVRPSVRLSVRRSVRLFVFVSLYRSLCPFVCPSVSLFVSLLPFVFSTLVYFIYCINPVELIYMGVNMCTTRCRSIHH